MKKMLFVIIAVVLIWWAWYVSQDTGPDSLRENNFDKALKVMQNMQSRATITEPLTANDLDILEVGFVEAQERKVAMQNFRDADLAKFTQKLTGYGVPTTSKPNETDIPELVALVKQKRDEYLNGYTKSGVQYPGIATAISNSYLNDDRKIEIRSLADVINEKSTELQIVTTFINNYTTLRPNICTTDGPAFDIYTVGTINFKYRTTTITDTCQNTNTKVKESRCIGFVYEDDSQETIPAGEEATKRNVKISDCALWCNGGKCLKGQLGTSIMAYKTNTTMTEEKDIDLNEPFFLRVIPSRVSSDVPGTLTVELSSPSLTNSKCTIPTTSTITQTLTATTPTEMNFGPISCSAAGNHVFTTTLKEGSNTIGTLTKTINTGIVAMKEFNFTSFKVGNGSEQAITPSSTITLAKNVPLSLTVQTIGTNDLPLSNYTKKFFVLVAGDDDRTIPETGQSMGGLDSKTITGIKFSKAGTITFTVRSEDSLFEKSIQIVVTDV